ncbi:PepSY-associated TM helix domain-containing protein [Pontibacter roseus]|uniref:PepSY-associated TM helix domain-containing protein n=1 Tax=Pontibacter roseus TaxID=336989 RepID=UPI000368237B|nr:PepSY-associated TM helix domain-containing protein [Pontibacter roseus]
MSTPAISIVKKKVKFLAERLRNFRVYHRFLGLAIGAFVLVSSLTGILLGWKKDVDLLQPPTQKGVTIDLQQWIPLSEMAALSVAGLDSAAAVKDNPIDRIEARLDKGIVKTIFVEGSWEVQLDASTGKVLSVARRHSDWIEKVHDGSIISDLFKLVSMNVLGLGLLVLTITGFFLWFYPRKIRQMKSE